eukprot:CAMPEP_0175738692 /NCGR_PEP_ID=MMETSP0097-20121207/54607_1 /TAXON_ID=311494 /ORGANISM="Alexandrium monilatum, Strain CCMP3105" /LENGTH=74 /DNA_ID=CAMNT_0017046907 /DNA_START=30 /DNA_END=254 /DNA_ORIENTATION=-
MPEGRRRCSTASDTDLAAPPVTAELVVADLRAGLHTKPLWERPVLLDLLRKVHLQLEGLHSLSGPCNPVGPMTP